MASSSPHQQQQPFLLLLPLLLLLLAPLVVPAAAAAPPAGAATSVYNLKPAQVDVVLALGDSITAGFGMEGKIGGLHEYRGKSWSIGGDANATTLPNFIRQHNPNVTGYSIGRREGSLCWGPLCRDVHRKKHDVLNGALSGAMIRNIHFDEFPYIMDVMSEMGIDVANSWKVLTLFIGANDVCVGACHYEKRFDAEEFGTYLREVLGAIRDHIPRVLVNVVELFNVSSIYRLTEGVPYCKHVHQLVFVECLCAFGVESEARAWRERMDALTVIYNDKIREVVAEFMQERNDTFAIALHPFTRNMNISAWTMDMVSSLDCFHPSEKSHALTATALWNSMLTPSEQRQRALAPSADLEPIVPSADAVFYPGYAVEDGGKKEGTQGSVGGVSVAEQ